MSELRFAVFGAGFWSKFQLAAWGEIPGVRCVAIYNRSRSKAEDLGSRFDVSAIYDDAEELLRREQLDFIDVVTDAGTHAAFTKLAARHRLPVVCQKPLAPSFGEARDMADVCHAAGVPLLVHENWRWQRPIRELKRVLDSGRIGRPFRGRLTFSNSFPVFDNQPFLKTLDQFIVTDIGTHVFDAARFLFGDPATLFCRTAKIHRDIRGEDVATALLGFADGAAVTCEMSYASRVEQDRFPETYVVVEGDLGTVELGPDYWVRVTTADGTTSRRVPPPRYAWADPAYDLVHASIVDCHRNLVAALRGESPAETTAEDNLRTLACVYAAYESAETGRAVAL